ALAAHQVVVVVADAPLKMGWPAGRFDLADQSGLGQRREHTVDGLQRGARELLLDSVEHLSCVEVAATAQYTERRAPRTGRPKAGVAQALRDAPRYVLINAVILRHSRVHTHNFQYSLF